MTYSPEQMRKKQEAMDDSRDQANNMTVTGRKPAPDGEPGTLDPTGIFSDESYIRGEANGPERDREMKKHGLTDDPKNPGVYGSKGKNY
jgi:hypothetical protein